ncbi:MAG: DUF4143 domain-containing protein [Propionibacteriaceae bacterium]|nr:DUF4143 domain-containing protein [Propionibacteriaceae bacterium]
MQGGVTENFVAQTLIANGITPFYWESKNEAQIDFVYQTSHGACIPIEVKPSEHVTSKSLGVFASKFRPEYSIRISRKNFGFENAIKSVPLYAAFCISATNRGESSVQ